MKRVNTARSASISTAQDGSESRNRTYQNSRTESERTNAANISRWHCAGNLSAGNSRCCSAGENARILHTHFASPDAPNVAFVQDASNLPSLEKQIQKITADSGFQEWTKKVSPLLRQSANREIHLVVAGGRQQTAPAK